MMLMDLSCWRASDPKTKPRRLQHAFYSVVHELVPGDFNGTRAPRPDNYSDYEDTREDFEDGESGSQP